MENEEFEYKCIYSNFENPISSNIEYSENFLSFKHRIDYNNGIGELSVSSVFKYANESTLYRGSSAFAINSEKYEIYRSIITTLIFQHIMEHLQFIEDETGIKIPRPSIAYVESEAFEG